MRAGLVKPLRAEGAAAFLVACGPRRSFDLMVPEAPRNAWLPVALYAQLVADDQVLPVFITHICERGLVLDALAIVANRRSDRLQLELRLPGEPGCLWIAGEVVHDERGLLFSDISLRFSAMANAHWRVLRRWVRVRELALATHPLGIHDAA